MRISSPRPSPWGGPVVADGNAPPRAPFPPPLAGAALGELTDREAMEAAAIELVRWTLGEFAYYKAPGYVAFVDRLPLTATNKIQRGELKALAPTLVGAANCVDTCAMKKRQERAT